MKKLFLFIGISLPFILNAQIGAVDVTEQTLKIGASKEEILYYGFAEGDKILFHFEEVNGKELKEVEVVEYPSNSKFMDYKTSKIEEKAIQVNRKSVYAFRLYNGAITGRICKVRIQRIPANETTKNFNTSVKWEEKADTLWNTYTKDVIVGYDTSYIQKTKKVLIKTEQKEEMLFDKWQRVHSKTNVDNPNKCNLKVVLPEVNSTELRKEKIISWAYWIGVGEEAKAAYEKNVKAFGKIAQSAASALYSPLAGFAVGLLTNMMIPTLGEDVEYWFITDYNNALAFMNGQTFYQFDKGKGVAAYGKNTSRLSGEFYIGMMNDNYTLGVDVNVKVVAIIEVKTYENQPYTETKVSPRYEKKIMREPEIKTKTIPVILN